ncbi:MAG: hypothetical protein P4L51_30375 [Puia sp.]|nr:hypothetical protein [Puia sp.]
MSSDSDNTTNFIKAQSRRRNTAYDSGAFVAFLIPTLRFIQVKVVGVLSGSDLVFLAIFLVLALRGKIELRTLRAKRFIVLCSLWLVSQCVTDVVRHSVFVDYARGWSNIGLTLINFVVLYSLLYDRPRRLIFYGWGLVVGGLLTFLITPDIYMETDPWKFGIAYPVSWATMLLVSRKKSHSYEPVFLCIVVGGLHVLMGARSSGGMCIVVALYLLAVRYFIKRGARRYKLRARYIAAVGTGVVLSVVGIFWGYGYAAQAGILGDDARKKYELQSSGKYGVLLGGRTEALSYVPAIIDSPILGHGSWAKDPTYIIAQRQALLMMGYGDALDFDQAELEEGLIPSHSIIFGAWVDAGILGVVFWGWVFVLTLKMLLRVYPPGIRLLPLASYAAFQLLWDLLFSPYGAYMRTITPYYIVLVMTCMDAMPLEAAPIMASVRKKRSHNRVLSNRVLEGDSPV